MCVHTQNRIKNLCVFLILRMDRWRRRRVSIEFLCCIVFILRHSIYRACFFILGGFMYLHTMTHICTFSSYSMYTYAAFTSKKSQSLTRLINYLHSFSFHLYIFLYSWFVFFSSKCESVETFGRCEFPLVFFYYRYLRAHEHINNIYVFGTFFIFVLFLVFRLQCNAFRCILFQYADLSWMIDRRHIDDLTNKFTYSTEFYGYSNKITDFFFGLIHFLS